LRLAASQPDTNADTGDEDIAAPFRAREKPSHVAPYWPGMEIMGMWL
jgi:hypothetical protein